MKRKYTLEEAKRTGRPSKIEVHAYNTKEDFERASVGIVESRGCHGRVRQPVSDRIYFIDDVLLIPKDTVYDYQGRMRLFLVHTPAYEQDSDVHLDDLWE